MRRYLLAAAAAAAIATPAVARDGQPYVGIEGGFAIAEDADFDVRVNDSLNSDRFRDAFSVDFKPGFDIDAIAGYDFGGFRLEGELGYKRFRLDDVQLSSQFGGNFDLANEDFDISSRAGILSLMANAMLDFGDDDGWSGFVGVGGGRARVKFGGDTDSAMAYQAIAGVRREITPNIDVGLKYRYFRTGKINFSDEFNDGTDFVGINASTKLRTHSLLASLIFNFGAPPVIVAPVIVEPVVVPPPPPATQTCYDGSVILATDVCPQPPVPEAIPPAPEPERG